MKITHILILLCASLLFAGCASTQNSAEEAQSEGVQSQDGASTGSVLLMDRYKTGEIPGYRD